MTEDKFWELIKLLNWSETGDDDAVVAPLVYALSEMPATDIYRFEDILSEKLWILDTKEHAQATNDWKEHQSLSSDGFLYERCCVVANGKSFF